MNAEAAESTLRKVLTLVAVVAAALLAAHFATLVGARHEFTQVETIVATHSRMLARGQGLYRDFERYPFTAATYGPIFYTISAGLYRAGLPWPMGGRLISFTALLGIVGLCWKLLRLYTKDRYALWTGTLLAASNPVLARWGTAGHVDVLGVFFALAAFHQYSRFRVERRWQLLVWAGALVVLAFFTKQTMLASFAAIVLLLGLESRKLAIAFLMAVAAAIAVLALALNAATNGGYFADTIVANINPLRWEKLSGQATQLLLTGGALMVVAGAGVRRALRGGLHPLYAYLGFALAVLAATAPKLGSEVNYQVETMIVLALCAGWTLGELQFFRLWGERDPGWVTLLEIPLILQIAVSPLLSAKAIYERWQMEPVRREEQAQLSPSLTGRALSVQLEPVVRVLGGFEVDTFLYTMLVAAHVVNPEPVRQDLAACRFHSVILFEDLFAPGRKPLDAEVPSLPPAHLEEIQRHYRLVRHIPGPYRDGDYLYEPDPLRCP